MTKTIGYLLLFIFLQGILSPSYMVFSDYFTNDTEDFAIADLIDLNQIMNSNSEEEEESTSNEKDDRTMHNSISVIYFSEVPTIIGLSMHQLDFQRRHSNIALDIPTAPPKHFLNRLFSLA